MNLTQSKTGCQYTVCDIKLEKRIKRRLEILGLTQGTDITVLRRKNRGSMIITIRGTRFAIGKQIASGIDIRRY